MRLILNILLIAIIAFFAGLYFSWWTIAVAAFIVVMLLPLRPSAAFVAGFTAIFLLWVVLAASINAANDGILAGRIGQLLKTGGSPFILVLVTGLVGGLVGGFSALSASYIRFKKK